jgi:hypothetical protein
MTISVRLDSATEKALVLAARADGISKSEFIRRCLRERLDTEVSGRRAWELGKDLFGKYGSGRSDVSGNSESYLSEIFDAKRNRH